MPDYIDQTAQQAAQALGTLREELLAEVVDYWGKHVTSRPEMLRNLQNVDFVDRLLVDFGGTEVIHALTDQYDAVIDSVSAAIGEIPQSTIAALKNQDAKIYETALRDIGTQVEREITKALATNVPEVVLSERLMQATKQLSGYQVNALVNTALRTTSRTVFAEGTQELPEDTKYIYTGPRDDRTRDDCLAGLDAGAVTKDEIIDLPVDMINGGGWNCRHSFEVVV